MAKTKILFLDSNINFMGGGSQSLLRHLELLPQADFSSYLGHADHDSQHNLQFFVNLGVACHPVFGKKIKTLNLLAGIYRLLIAVRRSRSLIKEKHIDIVVGNSVRACLVAVLATLSLPCYCLWYLRDYTFNRLIFRSLLFLTDYRLYISQHLQQYYGSDQPQDVVVGHGTNFANKLDNINSLAVVQQRTIWSDFSIVIGYVGRLVQGKGVVLLLQAVNNLIKNDVDCKLIIVGSGQGQNDNCESELKLLVKQYNLDRSVFFTGHQQNIALLMSSFDIFCAPNIEPEGFGMTIVEAMMAGLPVISTTVPGPQHLLKNNQSGLLVEPDNVEALTKALQLLISDFSLRQKLGQTASKIARENYNFAKINENILEVYKKLVKKV